MKLYYSPGACSIAVRIIINELNIPAEFEAVNLKTKQTASGQDFLSINPKGSVPVIITDQNDTLTENSVIQQYLADTNQATQLLPLPNDMKRYHILEWLNFVSTELHKTCGGLFNPGFPQEIKDNVIKPALKSKLDFVDAHLQKNTYLAGDHFTLPDSYLFVILSWLPIFKMDVANWPTLANYFAQLKTRPSVQRALQDEGLLTPVKS